MQVVPARQTRYPKLTKCGLDGGMQYKACFLPMAILFLLPGAIITNAKVMVSFGILKNANDEDAVNPFAGIFRSIIAIFLIPATQVIISYMVDVGNSLEYSCQPYISIPLIIVWAEEQVANIHT